MNQQSILVTGASGFTGRHFVPVAAARGYRCFGVSLGAGAEIVGAERTVSVDLTDRTAVFELMRDIQPDYLVHLAAISFVAHADVTELYLANVVGTINLLDAADALAPNLKRALIASSANVYGNADALPIRESSVTKPRNDYAVSKVAMELASSLRMNGGKLVLVRPFNYTGVGQDTQFLIPKIIAAYARRDESIELGNIEVSRDFSDVRDVVEAYVRLLDAPSPASPVNVCSERPISVREVLHALNRIAGYEPSVRSVPWLSRPQEIALLYGSGELLRSIVGEYRRFSFEDTLRWMYIDQCSRL